MFPLYVQWQTNFFYNYNSPPCQYNQLSSFLCISNSLSGILIQNLYSFFYTFLKCTTCEWASAVQAIEERESISQLEFPIGKRIPLLKLVGGVKEFLVNLEYREEL